MLFNVFCTEQRIKRLFCAIIGIARKVIRAYAANDVAASQTKPSARIASRRYPITFSVRNLTPFVLK